MIKHDELLAKYSGIWEKVNKSIKKEFVSEPISNETFLFLEQMVDNIKLFSDSCREDSDKNSDIESSDEEK